MDRKINGALVNYNESCLHKIRAVAALDCLPTAQLRQEGDVQGCLRREQKEKK